MKNQYYSTIIIFTIFSKLIQYDELKKNYATKLNINLLQVFDARQYTFKQLQIKLHASMLFGLYVGFYSHNTKQLQWAFWKVHWYRHFSMVFASDNFKQKAHADSNELENID